MNKIIFKLLLAVLVLSGCTTNQAIKLTPADSSLPRTAFEIGTFTNETQTAELNDYESFYFDELRRVLQEKGILTASDGPGKIILNTRVLDYSPGNAFKRWLMPGWGKTVCAAQVDLIDQASGSKIGMVAVRRSIGFGGAFTIGAYRTLFK